MVVGQHPVDGRQRAGDVLVNVHQPVAAGRGRQRDRGQVDAERGRPGRHVVGELARHELADVLLRFLRGAAHVRGEDHVRQPAQHRGELLPGALGLLGEHVDGGAGDVPALDVPPQRLVVDDEAAGQVSGTGCAAASRRTRPPRTAPLLPGRPSTCRVTVFADSSSSVSVPQRRALPIAVLRRCRPEIEVMPRFSASIRNRAAASCAPTWYKYVLLRINRIFEGTNEINRMLIIQMLMKRALSGALPLIPAAMKLADEVLAGPSFQELTQGALAEEMRTVANCKKIFLQTAGGAVQKFRDRLAEEQELIGALANMVMEIYAMESSLLRAQKSGAARGEQASGAMMDAARVLIHDAAGRVEEEARRALGAVHEGDMLTTQMAVLKRFSKRVPVDTIGLRRRVAAAVQSADRYPFEGR